MIVGNKSSQDSTASPREKLNTAEDLRLPEEDCMKIKTCEKIYMDVGRPVVYGLAAKGEYGARRLTEMLKDDPELTMALFSYPTLNDITRNHCRMSSYNNHHCRM
ncbi:peroxisomal (S)-2-hydroxy-acid oxidase GLO4-like protein [Tanacetum coccineum]